MNRRQWFRDLAVKAAAVTAFCAVAPSVKAEAIEASYGYWAMPDPPMPPEAYLDGPLTFAPPKPGDIKLVYGRIMPRSFEAMAADCEARGCRLKIHEPDDGWLLLTHYPEGLHTQANLEYKGGIEMVLARVDAWRQLLHDPVTMTTGGLIVHGGAVLLTRDNHLGID